MTLSTFFLSLFKKEIWRELGTETFTIVHNTLLISHTSIINLPPGSTHERSRRKVTESLMAIRTPALFLSELAKKIWGKNRF